MFCVNFALIFLKAGSTPSLYVVHPSLSHKRDFKKLNFAGSLNVFLSHIIYSMCSDTEHCIYLADTLQPKLIRYGKHSLNEKAT